MNIVERLLSYIGYDTQSDGHSKSCPSTEKQKILGAHLVGEMKSMGLTDVHMDEHGYVYGVLEKNIDKDVPTVGLIAHMDTSPDFAGENIKPQMIEDYDGGDIVLDCEKNIIMSIEAFPNLAEYKGETLITTDGSTLLGADDKAGIAAILDAIETIIRDDVPHGTVKVGFTPDEEIGRGADLFDVKGFGADFAYTVDGGELGQINYENFNAATASVKISGINIHPGTAKNKMKNALLIAMELNSMLPSSEIPSNTELREGFYHLNDLSGNVENASMVYIIRDHDLKHFEDRKTMMIKAVEFINHKYGKETIELTLTDSYFNMLEKFSGEHMSIIEMALEAMKRSDVEAKILPIRGGTDGARLSYMGLLTPNLFTGGMNFHGKFECIPVESLKKSSEVVQNIVKLIAE